MIKRTFGKICAIMLVLLLAIIILAACGKDKYKVDFLVDGEIYCSLKSGENEFKLPDAPEKDGYVFDGWYLDEDSWEKPFTQKTLTQGALSSNVSVYARWKAPDELSGTQIELDGFSQDEDNVYNIKVSNTTKSLEIEPLLSLDERSSWVLSTDPRGKSVIKSKTASLAVGNNIYYALVTDVSGETQVYTFKIRRKPTYNVIFDVAGGKSLEIQTVEEDGLATEPVATRDGYDFLGWDHDFSAPITENKVITASWRAKEYTVAYDAAGGSVDGSSFNILYGKKYTLATPTRENYEFLGWYYGDKRVDDLTWSVPANATLVARWDPCKYDISYDLKGGSVDTPNPTVYTVESEDITLINPTRTGYIFLGWTGTGISEPATSVTLPSGSVGAREYSANWECEDYVIVYHLNGGDNAIGNPNGYNIESESISLIAPTRTGYSFAGWYKSEDLAEDSKISVIPAGTSGDLNLYAKWTANSFTVTLYDLRNTNPTYTVSFDLNGASGTAPAPQTVTKQTGLSYPAVPERSGYVFAGWYADSSCSGSLYDFTADITGNITLYAKWVSYSGYGTLNVGGNSGSITFPARNQSNYRYYAFVPLVSGSITIYSSSSNDTYGYLFDSNKTQLTYNDDSGDGNNFKMTYNVTAGQLYYVVACAFSSSSSYTGIIYIDGASAPASGGVSSGEIIVTDELTYGQSFTLEIPTKEGYRFLGWYDGEAGSGTQYTDESGVSVRAWDKDADATLYAKWEAGESNVSFDKQNGTGGSDGVSVTYDSAMPSATAPTRTGYTFMGYYTAVNGGGVKYYNADMTGARVWDLTEDTVLYAYWSANEYTVTFDNQGGSGASSVTVEYGSSLPYVSKPTKTGYTFLGYYDSATGGEQYYSADMDSMLTTWSRTEGITLYARWKANEYTVSFSANGGSGAQGSVLATYGEAMPEITVAPTRTGYIFLGYYDSASGGVKYYNADLTSEAEWSNASDKTLYAHWQGVSYSVSFNANGGSGTMSSQIFEYGVSESLNANTFTRTGYSFAGWNTEADGNGISYSDNAAVSDLTSVDGGSVTLYAQWTIKTVTVTLYDLSVINPTYTVSFDLNGASGAVPAPQTVTKENAIVYPQNPTRSGYVFAGWYTTSACTEEYNFSDNITSDMTLYAGWKTCSVTSNSWTTVDGVLKSTNTTASSKSVYKITAPVAIRVSFSYKVSSESNYDFLSINKNGSNLKKISGSTTYVSYSVDLAAGEYLTFEYSKDGSVNSGDDCGYISDLTITSAVAYTGTGLADGEIIVTDELTYGQSFTLEIPTKEGYRFLGWYDGEAGSGTQYTDENGVSVRAWDKDADAMLYAKWELI